MNEITIYSSDSCTYCLRAKKLLENKGIKYKEVNLDHAPGQREEISKKTGMKTIPQIFIGEDCIGGFTELAALETSGELDKYIKFK